MSNSKETEKKPKEKKPAAKKTASPAKKTTPAARKTAASGTQKKKTQATKKTTQSKTSASAGWQEKKAQIRQRNKEPKTIAERKAYREHGPIRRFFMKYTAALDLIAVPFFVFSLLCLYSVASNNERPAAAWCANFSKSAFGGISYLFYFWVMAFCIRIWLRNL